MSCYLSSIRCWLKWNYTH